MEILKEVCTCDDFTDEPCPRHKRENELQDMVIELRKDNRILRDIIFGYNKHLVEMQMDCMKYLDPGNTECGEDWFIGRIIYYLDNPALQSIQRHSSGFGEKH